MHVCLDFLGHVKVDDMLHIWEIQTFGRHVCGNNHIGPASFECLHGKLTILLRLSTMRAYCIHTLKQQVFVNVVDICLVLAENDCRRRRLLQTLEKIDDARFLFDVLDLLDDVEVGCTGAANVDHDGPHESRFRKVHNMLGHSRREKHGLALPLKIGEDLADFVLEAHVNHAISLVERQIAAQIQTDALLSKHVHETSRRRHTHVRAVIRGLCLLTHVDATHCKQAAKRGVAASAQRFRVLQNNIVRLASKLARGVDTQPQRTLALDYWHLTLLLKCHHNHRQRKHECLA
mmetsp:Transcript_25927/g.38076  ORF Transcript_25927/g.38076 Transcript_25927/m.38076 type:complete len:290 (-) Transcript_25927:1257-2126(-)